MNLPCVLVFSFSFSLSVSPDLNTSITSYGTSSFFWDVEYGGTFETAVVAFVLGLLWGIGLCVLAGHAGDGPFYTCLHGGASSTVTSTQASK